MTNGIVSLTRPRFGKRSLQVEDQEGDEDKESYDGSHLAYGDVLATDLMSPLTKAIYVYLVKNYAKRVSNPQSNLYTQITRPRFGKRSLYGPAAVLKLIRVWNFKSICIALVLFE